MREQEYVSKLVYTLSSLSPDEQRAFSSTIESEFRSGTVAILFGVFLGLEGADRYYNKQYFLGLLKLFTLGGLTIWTIYDWFSLPGKIRQANLEVAKEYVLQCKSGKSEDNLSADGDRRDRTEPTSSTTTNSDSSSNTNTVKHISCHVMKEYEEFDRLIKLHPPSHDLWSEFVEYLGEHESSIHEQRNSFVSRMINALEISLDDAVSEFHSIKNEIDKISYPFDDPILNHSLDRVRKLGDGALEQFMSYVSDVGEYKAVEYLDETIESLAKEFGVSEPGNTDKLT